MRSSNPKQACRRLRTDRHLPSCEPRLRTAAQVLRGRNGCGHSPSLWHQHCLSSYFSLSPHLVPPPSITLRLHRSCLPNQLSPKHLSVAMTRCTTSSTCRNAVTSVPTRKQTVFPKGLDSDRILWEVADEQHNKVKPFRSQGPLDLRPHQPII